jgi:hypothetical protein
MEYTYTIKPKKRKLYKEDIPEEDQILFQSYIPPSENVKYNSYFFRSDIISDYVTRINRISKQNGKQSLFRQNYKLYNMDDIIYYLLNKPGIRTRNYDTIIQSKKWKQIKKYIIALIPLTLGEMCSETVRELYTKSSFKRNIKKIISGEDGSNIYDDDIVIMASREIEHYISYQKIIIEPAEIYIDTDTDSDSDSDIDSVIIDDKQDYRLKRIQNVVDEELEEELEEEIKENNDIETMEDIIEKLNDFEELNFASYEEQFKEKLKMIVGFMIVSRGKCKIFPNDYILNLICTNMSGVGTILIGLYLYTILRHPIVPMTGENLLFSEDLELTGNSIAYYEKIKKSKTFKKNYRIESKYGIDIFKRKFMTTDELIPTNGMAILELSNSYYNYPGLCLYQKIGFEYDKSLFSKDPDIRCIYDYGNLPMSIDFSDENLSGCYVGLTTNGKIRKLLNIIVGNGQCNRNKICVINNEKHKKLLSALNELIVYQDSCIKFNNIIDYDIKKNKKIKKYDNILDAINSIKSLDETNYEYIKKIISDIDNDNITSDVERLLTNFFGGKKINILTKKQKKIKNNFNKKTKKIKNKKYFNKKKQKQKQIKIKNKTKKNKK